MIIDFMVRIDTTAVSALPEDERADLMAREWERGRELHRQGILRRLWRLPGQRSNIGLWSARDADELHDALTSLPIWPLVTTEVTPLGTHPLFVEIDRDEGKDGTFDLA